MSLSLKSNVLRGPINICILDLILLLMDDGPNSAILTHGPLIVDFPILTLTGSYSDSTFNRKNVPNLNLVYVNNTEFVHNYLDDFFATYIVKPTMKYLFYGHITPDITRAVQKFYVKDAIFVDISTGVIYTYYPFRYKNIQKIDYDLVEVGKCNNGSSVIKPPFDDNSWDYKGWTLTIQNVKCKSGLIATDVLKLIVNHLKLDYNLTCKGINKTYRDLLVDHLFDIWLHYQPIVNNFRFTSTIPYHFDSLSIYILAPSTHSAPTSSNTMWCTIFASLIFLSFFLVIVRRYLRNGQRKLHPHICLYPESILTIFLLLIEFYFVYKGRLLHNGKSTEVQDYEIRQEDFTNRTFKIGFPDDISVVRRYLIPYKNRILCPRIEQCLRSVISKNSDGVLLMDRNHEQIRRKFENETVRFVKVIPPRETNHMVVYCFARGHPLVGVFDKYLQLFRENGIIERFMKKYVSTDEMKPIHKKLGFESLRAAFVFLCIGLSVSLAVFVIEVKTIIKFRIRIVD